MAEKIDLGKGKINSFHSISLKGQLSSILPCEDKSLQSCGAPVTSGKQSTLPLWNRLGFFHSPYEAIVTIVVYYRHTWKLLKNFIKLNPLRKDWQQQLKWYNFDYKFIMPWRWMSQWNRHFSWQHKVNLLVVAKYNFPAVFSVYGGKAFKFEAVSSAHITAGWRTIILNYASSRCGPSCVGPCCRWNNLEWQSYVFQQHFSQALAEKLKHCQLKNSALRSLKLLA